MLTEKKAEAYNVKFSYDDEEFMPFYLENITIDIDIRKMSQVVRNLVDNALLHTPTSGKVTVRASFRISALGECDDSDQNEHVGVLLVEVSDTGHGMSQVRYTYKHPVLRLIYAL